MTSCKLVGDCVAFNNDSLTIVIQPQIDHQSLVDMSGVLIARYDAVKQNFKKDFQVGRMVFAVYSFAPNRISRCQ